MDYTISNLYYDSNSNICIGGKILKDSLKAFSLTLILVLYAIGVVTVGRDLADKWNDVVGLLFVIAGILNLSILYWF